MFDWSNKKFGLLTKIISLPQQYSLVSQILMLQPNILVNFNKCQVFIRFNQKIWLAQSKTLCIWQNDFVQWTKFFPSITTLKEKLLIFFSQQFKRLLLFLLLPFHLKKINFKAMVWLNNVSRFLPYRHFSLCVAISMQNEIPSWKFVMLSISIRLVHSGHDFIFQRNSNMLLFGQNNETLLFGPKKKILRFIRNFLTLNHSTILK